MPKPRQAMTKVPRPSWCRCRGTPEGPKWSTLKLVSACFKLWSWSRSLGAESGAQSVETEKRAGRQLLGLVRGDGSEKDRDGSPEAGSWGRNQNREQVTGVGIVWEQSPPRTYSSNLEMAGEELGAEYESSFRPWPRLASASGAGDESGFRPWPREAREGGEHGREQGTSARSRLEELGARVRGFRPWPRLASASGAKDERRRSLNLRGDMG